MDNNASAAIVSTPEASTTPTLPPPAAPQAQSRQRWLQQLTANGGGSGDGMFSQLSSNPLFSAGFALAALGAATRYGLKAVTTTAKLLRRRLLVSVEVTGNDKAFTPLLNWMVTHQQSHLLGQTTQHTNNGILSSLFRRLVPGAHELQARTTTSKAADGQDVHHFTLVPGPGRHILHYRNTFLAVTRSREGTMPSMATSEPFETITMTTLYSQRHIFESIFLEAQAIDSARAEGKTTIYTPKMIEWKPFGHPKRKRPLSSVILEAGVKEHILADIQSFLDSRAWYLDRGIPYRRGYLLWGPPGTGKTSFIEALAGHLDFNIAMLHLSERGMTDDRLNVLLHAVPPRTLVLLEDADAAFVNRRQADADGYQGATVTFSGLLNALDGVVSAEERIVFLTTNHVERMDGAVVRPGRVDVTVRLGEADEGQVREMWRRFYGEGKREAEEQGHDVQETKFEDLFVQRLEELGMLGKVSTAQLQGHFVLCKDKPEEAIARIEGLSADLGVAQRAVMK